MAKHCKVTFVCIVLVYISIFRGGSDINVEMTKHVRCVEYQQSLYRRSDKTGSVEMIYLSICMLDAKHITNLVIHLWNVYGKCFIKTESMFDISKNNIKMLTQIDSDIQCFLNALINVISFHACTT